MPSKTFDAIFTEVEKASKKADKIKILHENSGPVLKQILGLTYDPKVKWLLPEGDPPYTPLPKDADAEISMGNASRQFYLFIEGDTDTQRNLKQLKREALFIQLLESVNPAECKILLGMKNRKLPYRGLTRKLVAEAFPNLAKDWF
jgi:hypothetical protein